MFDGLILPKEDSCPRYFRARVHVDISKPLKRGSFLHMGDDERRWIGFTYEKLPVYYYLCGVVEHLKKNVGCGLSTILWIRGMKAQLHYYGVSIYYIELAGGLAMFWQKEIDVNLLNFCAHHIDIEVQLPNNILKWCCTGFYGYPDHNDRWSSWSLLRQLASLNPLLWILGGDFRNSWRMRRSVVPKSYSGADGKY